MAEDRNYFCIWEYTGIIKQPVELINQIIFMVIIYYLQVGI